jgi:D-3-phosphoglycerate dehydrogenase
MKILIADKLPDKYLDKLKEDDVHVVFDPKLGEEDLVTAAEDADILVVRSTKVNAKTIENSKALSLIVRAGSGYNNIDVSAANKKGIYVANCPGKNAIAVAELTIGLMIALDRRIPSNVMDFKNGVWNKAEYSKGKGLYGRTLAIVGMGNIGREVAKRANAFGMHVYGKDISRIEGVDYKDFSEMDKVLPLADIVTVHLPATAQTKNLFNKEMFSYMKKGAYFINTSRPSVVDEEALLEAIEERDLKVALDVFQTEPEQKTGSVTAEKLQNNDNVYVTHHIGASTQQAQEAVADEVIHIIHDYMTSGIIPHWVNRARLRDKYYQLVVKHYDKPGVLASVLDVLKNGDINVEEVENIVFDGGQVATCTMKLAQKANEDMLKSIRNNSNVITVSHMSVEED